MNVLKISLLIFIFTFTGVLGVFGNETGKSLFVNLASNKTNRMIPGSIHVSSKSIQEMLSEFMAAGGKVIAGPVR